MVTQTFADLGLSPKVLKAIDAAGYTTPTPIQAAAIPVALTGRDVLGIAQTGTGKTAAFTMPMITRLETGRARARMPRSLILAPTRELAAQVAQSFEKYGVNHKLNVALLIGGVSMKDQVTKLDRGVDVLIATPGRMLDHFQRGKLMLMGVEILVIDEADRMLDMGFIPDIEKICKLLPPRRQTLFFSATMPDEITRLVNTFLKDPERIEVARPATTAQTITQLFHYCANAGDSDKRETLRKLIRDQDVKNAIIFCNRKRDVAILLKSLLKHGFNAGALHGDMDQKSRMETLDGFRNGEISLLSASDVAARGLDIPDVSHIFNFDLPWQSDDYVHRIGRTGRAGKQGTSVSLVSNQDFKILSDIEGIIGAPPTWIGDAPTEDDKARGLEDRGKRRGGGRGRGGKSESTSRDRSRSPRSETPRSNAPRSDASRADAPSADAPKSETPTQATTQSQPPTTDGRTEGAPTQTETAQERPRRRRRQSSRDKPSTQTEATPNDRASADAPKQQPANPSRRASSSSANTEPGKAHARGFADNVPAFLKRPPKRTTKAASE